MNVSLGELKGKVDGGLGNWIYQPQLNKKILLCCFVYVSKQQSNILIWCSLIGKFQADKFNQAELPDKTFFSAAG
jgi:hypothetical protein